MLYDTPDCLGPHRAYTRSMGAKRCLQIVQFLGAFG